MINWSSSIRGSPSCGVNSQHPTTEESTWISLSEAHDINLIITGPTGDGKSCLVVMGFLHNKGINVLGALSWQFRMTR